MSSPKAIALILAFVLAVSACSGAPEASPASLETRLAGEVVFETEYVDDEYGRIWVDGFEQPPEIVDGVLFVGARDSGTQSFYLQLDAMSGELLAIAPHERDFDAGCSRQNRFLDLRLGGDGLEDQFVVASDPWSGDTRWTRPAPDGCEWEVDNLGQVWERSEGELRRLDPANGNVLWAAELPKFASQPKPVRHFLFPTVDEPGLIVVQGLQELVAFDVATGETSWSRPLQGPQGCDFRRTQQTIWAIPPGGGVVVVDAASGEERWRRDYLGMGVLSVSDQVVLVSTGDVNPASCGSSASIQGSITALRSTDGSAVWTDYVPENGQVRYVTPGPFGAPDPLDRGIIVRIRSLEFGPDGLATSIETVWIDEASGVELGAPHVIQVPEPWVGIASMTVEPGLTYSFDGPKTIFSLDGTAFHARSDRPGQRALVLDEYVLITGMTLTAIR